MQTLRDIRACVEDEPATGPWYAVRHSDATFAIFEAFPPTSQAATHMWRAEAATFSATLSGMNNILARPAHVQKVDVLFSKQVFSS